MLSGKKLSAGALLLAATVAMRVSAAPLFVQNSSFETPGALGNFIGLVADGWTFNGPGPAASFGPETSPTTDVIVYYNSAPGTQGFPLGATGNQALSIFPIDHAVDAGTGLPTGPSIPASAIQPLADQTTSAPVLFKAGKQYQIIVDLATAGTAPPPAGILKIALGYINGGVEMDVATRLVQNDPNSLTGANKSDNGTVVNDNNFLTFSALSSGVLAANDPAVGQQINIVISGTGPGGGEFNVDNVRVNELPEPTCMSLAAVGTGLLLRRRVRKNAR